MYYALVFLIGLNQNFFEYYLVNSIMNREKMQTLISLLSVILYSYFGIYYIMYYPSLASIGGNLYLCGMWMGKLIYFFHFRYKSMLENIFNSIFGRFTKRYKIKNDDVKSKDNIEYINYNDNINRWGEE